MTLFDENIENRCLALVLPEAAIVNTVVGLSQRTVTIIHYPLSSRQCLTEVSRPTNYC
ncbi:hypothetical protein EG68_09704 [Paragonimus skrjabini miyazakii]|uniref:Uncharacterized protein n=1 Tax=Paragonimus skrjabini miyazakii TaxID=59628 RepID=A0A8S9YGX5_9TREM|nr:hypothetical protein EG68_09704 [Paragonimus skrjabini miyazakii]